MTNIGSKTRYIQSITAQDDTHDTLALSNSDPTASPPPPPGIITVVDSLVVAKPHTYVTGQPITLDYSVADPA